MNNKEILSGILAISSVLASVSIQAYTLEIPRQISRSINDRLDVNFNNVRQQSAPASESNVWDALSYTSIDSEFGTDADLYQATLGIDQRWGDINAGVAVTYARLEQSGFFLSDKSNVPAFIPYVDYTLNQYMHVTAMGGYIRKEGVGNKSFNVNIAFTDISLNTELPIIPGLSIKPRAGYRFAYSDFDFPHSGSATTYTNTLYAEGGLEYTMNNLAVYFESLYERVVIDNQLPNPVDGGDLVFITAGIDYHVNQTVSLGVAYRHQILESNVDYHQATAHMNMRF
ncbi:MAG TPA: hypothetical protein ENJ32_10980 [Crenotrichaceae bacterium]|nr:hypothetical protein [Crenotrichaceae bacterium]